MMKSRRRIQARVVIRQAVRTVVLEAEIILLLTVVISCGASCITLTPKIGASSLRRGDDDKTSYKQSKYQRFQNQFSHEGSPSRGSFETEVAMTQDYNKARDVNH